MRSHLRELRVVSTHASIQTGPGKVEHLRFIEIATGGSGVPFIKAAIVVQERILCVEESVLCVFALMCKSCINVYVIMLELVYVA